MSSISPRGRSRTLVLLFLIARAVCSVLLTFTLFKFGGNLRLNGVPVYFYYNLIEKTLENDAIEDGIVPRLETVDDTFEKLRQHKELLRQKRMRENSDGDPFRDYFFAIGKVHEERVVAKAFDMAHQENMKNYAITAKYSRRTNNELVKEAEASRLTRERLDKLNSILSNEFRNLEVLREQTAESLKVARSIHEKLLEREKFIQEIRDFFGRGPLWIIWEYVQWVFDLILDFLIGQLLCFEAFLLNDEWNFQSISATSE